MDLFQTIIHPNILENFQNFIQDIKDWSEKFSKYFSRLKIVKTNKILMPKLSNMYLFF